MTLTEKLTKAYNTATYTHPKGRCPNLLYLGDSEDRELRHLMMPFCIHLGSPVSRPEYVGCPIFRVDAESHIHFSHDHL